MPVDPYGRHTVQPQEDQIHEVILGEGIFLEMRVDQAQTAQTGAALAALGEVGYEERAGATDEHHLDGAVSGEEEPDLAAGLERQASEIPCQFG
jgi:hypothetical protein